MAKSSQSDRPRLACEITAERVIAGRANGAGDALDAYTSRALASGTLVPSLIHSNVPSPESLRQAIADTLIPVAGGIRDVTAILPDTAVRVTLLDFDVLPDKAQEADAVVRFRLKKSLPFDPDTAAISYDVQRTNGMVRVMAAVALRSVLEEYEAAFRDAGFYPGVVLPSMLATLSPVSGAEPTLVVKVDPLSTSLAIVDQDEVRLFRTLEEGSASDLSAERLGENIHPSLAFFEDTYNVKVPRILLGGLASAERLGSSLQAQTGARVADLVPPEAAEGALQGSLPASYLAAVVGALVG